MKAKVKVSNGQLTVQIKLNPGAAINEQEMNLFSRHMLRGFLKPSLVKPGVLDYTGPVGLTLGNRLKKPISRYDFYFIVEQVLDTTQKLRRQGCPWNKVIWDMQYAYFNEATKELQLIYLPLVEAEPVGGVVDFLEKICSAAQPTGDRDVDYVGRFSYRMRTTDGFDPVALENFIAQEEPTVVSTLRHHRAEGSGFMTDKRQDYYKHYEAKSQTPPQPAAQPYQPAQPAPQPYQPAQPAPQPYQPAQPAPQPYQPAQPAPQPYQPAQPAAQPYQPAQPAPQPYQPAQPAQPAYQSIPQPVFPSGAQSIPQPVFPGAAQPAAQPAARTAPQPVFPNVSQPASQPAAKPVMPPAYREAPAKPYDEEATDLLQGEGSEETTLLTDPDSEATSLLVENQVHYASLVRVLTGENVSLDKPVFRVGKERGCVDYCVTDNNAVSRRHIDIVTRGGRYFVIDLNSKNRTFINDQMIPIQFETEIRDGDRLRLGNEEFVFQI